MVTGVTYQLGRYGSVCLSPSQSRVLSLLPCSSLMRREPARRAHLADLQAPVGDRSPSICLAEGVRNRSPSIGTDRAIRFNARWRVVPQIGPLPKVALSPGARLCRGFFICRHCWGVAADTAPLGTERTTKKAPAGTGAKRFCQCCRPARVGDIKA
jgi:hypothetical protein